MNVLQEPNRKALEGQVKVEFLDLVTKGEESHRGRALVSQSCRSIFYYVIRSLLEEAEQRTGKMRIKIGLPGKCPTVLPHISIYV